MAAASKASMASIASTTRGERNPLQGCEGSRAPSCVLGLPSATMQGLRVRALGLRIENEVSAHRAARWQRSADVGRSSPGDGGSGSRPRERRSGRTSSGEPSAEEIRGGGGASSSSSGRTDATSSAMSCEVEAYRLTVRSRKRARSRDEK